MTGTDNKLVFVSYAHADQEFLDEELMPFLDHLVNREHIELWNDQLIGTGDNWYAEIADRLDHAKVAILLITPAFLGSKFCQHEEVPVLLQRARRGELGVLPLFAEPCLWDNEPWLRRVQMWPTDGKAISEYDAPTRKRLLTEFLRRIRDAVDAPDGQVHDLLGCDDLGNPDGIFLDERALVLYGHIFKIQPRSERDLHLARVASVDLDALQRERLVADERDPYVVGAHRHPQYGESAVDVRRIAAARADQEHVGPRKRFARVGVGHAAGEFAGVLGKNLRRGCYGEGERKRETPYRRPQKHDVLGGLGSISFK